MPLVPINGIDIFYEISGADHKESILLIAGMGSQMTSWSDDFCEALVRHGYRVIRFDNRDAGKSSILPNEARSMSQLMELLEQGKVPEGAYSLHDMAADTIALMDVLGIEKAHIFGRSMGGIITQLIASDFPDRVHSATIIMSSSNRPGLPAASPEIMQLMLSPLPDFETDPDLYIQKRLVFKKAVGGSFPFQEAYETTRIKEEATRAGKAHSIGQICAMALTAFDEGRLRRIQCPCLVIHGTVDPIFPIACGQDIAQRIPNATLLEIAGMGHSIPKVLYPKIINAFSNMVRHGTSG